MRRATSGGQTALTAFTVTGVMVIWVGVTPPLTSRAARRSRASAVRAAVTNGRSCAVAVRRVAGVDGAGAVAVGAGLVAVGTGAPAPDGDPGETVETVDPS